MPELTSEQKAAVESRGKVIVSASAGSGKTFVMIQKLVGAIENGADLDSVLAVTFTKKAAAQMKEKLRTALIKRVEGADGELKAHLKSQLSKIPSADISTIHSLCARLLRTYFYALDIDGGFDIISDDDATSNDLKSRALDSLFDRLYAEDDDEFKHLLSCFVKKRSDLSLRRLVLEGYSKVRTVARYENVLQAAENQYTVCGFEEICAQIQHTYAEKYRALMAEVERFEDNFPSTAKAAVYTQIFAEMRAALDIAASSGIFAVKPALSITAKPRDGEEDREAGELYKEFRKNLSAKYSSIGGDFSDRDTELEKFLSSGKTAVAFSHLILAFDREYAAVKRDENKLDYNDLEHLTLKLLGDEGVRTEINSKYKYVYVDEYQDVNPVQEEIISAMEGEVFLVGDVKQAIYGFRGSKSLFFAEKYDRFEGGGGKALRLSSNFRSCKNVLDFVNDLFSEVMRTETCGFEYAANSKMTAGGAYPADSGGAAIHLFGKEQKQEAELGVYSVLADNRDTSHTREGLAVLAIVERELESRHYDLNSGKYVDTQPGDICILTRKNKGGSPEGIVRALKDAGYSVAGAQEPNICLLPEVKQMIDILSLIDNAEQDIPLVTALLSPLGGLTEDELARVRIACRQDRTLSFRGCVEVYRQKMRGEVAQKLNTFAQKLESLRALSDIMTAGELIDIILEQTGLEAVYSAGSGEKLKNILKLAEEGPRLTLSAFLEKLKVGGYDVAAPSSAPSDSIKIMTMHAAKGLEFPVVIIADICRTFKGMDYSEVPFDDEYGFSPKFHDGENMLYSSTVLRRLCKLRADREELKNELNLFYVACTRAMCRLHIMAESIKEYSRADALEAKCYAQTFDMSCFALNELPPREEISARSDEVKLISRPDEGAIEAIERRFMQPYKFAESIDLPVKSSASAMLKASQEEPHFAEHKLFSEEGETGTERGIAYHRFLELADFSQNSLSEVEAQIENFLRSGRITAEQRALLKAEELSEILKMPVFSDLRGATLYREQEFLCRMRACDILPSEAEDAVLVQGAIDLLAVGDFGVRIIDYKYSKKSDGQLIATYSRQLALYKKAVSIITGTAEDSISTAIVNIYRRTQILL